MLRIADDMMRDGKSQKDACKSLGISVMTLHRWRKHAPPVAASAFDERQDLRHQDSALSSDPSEVSHRAQVEDLVLENQRLRRIVSDLLLEKVKVQEALDKIRR
jgi:putative transposase